MFTKPNPKQNFFELEQQILSFWKSKNILNKSIEQRASENSKTFYDGPITANGAPHIGHALTFSMKDLIPRYWSMKGFRVTRSLGWDCQGLPVEYEIEKQLGFKDKKDIEKFGIEKFNELCKNLVLEKRDKIIELEEMMGRLTNSEEEYATMDSKYIESIWWSLKEIFNKGLLYEGFKVVPYSTRAGTTLSNAEVALGGYKNYTDPAITVEFPLEEDPSVSVLAWTTTPWTIPGNLALAVGESIDYVKVKSENKSYIVAKDLVNKIFENKEFSIESEFKGLNLIGKKYIPPFSYYKGKLNCHVIYNGFHVNTESGTGIVHLAPYGAEDNEIFQTVGIESFDYLDDQGDFKAEITNYANLNYRDANPKIIEDLKSLNTLFDHKEYEHELPMCWRTGTPLIYKPITSWYIAVSKLRNELVLNNEKVNWNPKHIKHGRFGNWLAEIKDWGISRSRYWGTPLPIWKSESGKVIVIGSFEELKEYSGVEITDPHRPFIDNITFEKDGEKYKRILDVIDVWYDSGAMPFARFHYPFENKEKFENKFPAEYIAEGIDQTRGWFYSLLAISTTVFNKEAYKNVLINGTIVADDGAKLSKSKKNYVDPDILIKEFGADCIRINFFNSPIASGEDAAVSPKTLKLQTQEFILPIWNIFSYLVTYANIHNWKPLENLAYNARKNYADEFPWDHIPFGDIDNELQAWIILRLQETILQTTQALDNYEIQKGIKSIKSLFEDISKWYIRSSRDQFASGENSFIDVLYYVFIEALKLLAPFAPFIPEYIYQELVVKEIDGAKESIHLTDFPEADLKFIESYSVLLNQMDLLRKICEKGHTLRVNNQLKVRQPLSELIINSSNANLSTITPWMENILKNELNIKNVKEAVSLNESGFIKVTEDTSLNIKIGLNIELTNELKDEGYIREITRSIQAARKKMGLIPGQEIKINFKSELNSLKEVIERNKDEIKKITSASSIEFTDNLTLGFEIKIDNDSVLAEINL